MRFATSMVVLALVVPAPVVAQAPSRADLVGTWVETGTIPERAFPDGTKEPATTYKSFLVFQDDGTSKSVATKRTPAGVDTVFLRGPSYRWILAGDSLWSGSADQTEAEIRETMKLGLTKIMISNDTLRLAPYESVDGWVRASGKPYPWRTYARSTEPVP